MRGNGVAEGSQHDRASHPAVRGHVQGIAGAVIQPGQNLDVDTSRAVEVREPVVGEVGLPTLVRLGRFEADVGGLGSLGRLGHDSPGPDQDLVDRGPRQARAVVAGQVPASPSAS